MYIITLHPTGMASRILEGVKMALDRGVNPPKEEFLNGHWKNLHRLWIWLMIGPM